MHALVFALAVSLLTYAGSLSAHASIDTVAQAVQIARQGLSSNVIAVRAERDTSAVQQCLVAGTYQYRSLWAWDFGFAAMGALKVGQAQAVRDSLELYFSHQDKTGLLPRVIDNETIEKRVIYGVLGKKLPFKSPLIPQYITENKVVSPIPNAVLPWVASRYVQFTGDRAFAEKWFETAEKSLQWLESTTFQDGLIRQDAYSDWEDSIQRKGRVAFTNELYAVALRGLSEWAGVIGRPESQIFYAQKYSEFLRHFHAFFWVPERNVLLNFEGDPRLTADANLFAVAFGLLSPEESSAVMGVLRASPLWKPIPGRPTWPSYPSSMKSALPKAMGLSGYHDELYWYWITAVAVLAERKVGQPLAADAILQDVSKRIVMDGAVREVYDLKSDGVTLKPVRRYLYRAEVPFTWSAGFFLEAALP